jgi:hypothetical protein
MHQASQAAALGLIRAASYRKSSDRSALGEKVSTAWLASLLID